MNFLVAWVLDKIARKHLNLTTAALLNKDLILCKGSCMRQTSHHSRVSKKDNSGVANQQVDREYMYTASRFGQDVAACAGEAALLCMHQEWMW